MDKALNTQQQKAVNFGKGPLLIIAGAGTGKTTVITERIKHLIESGLAAPSGILALTFTEKASREMETRVDEVLPLGYTEMWIMTFHSFCDRVLRAEALSIGLDTKFKLMTEAETTQLIRDNLFKFSLDYYRPLGNPTKFVSGLMTHFSRLQDEDVTPEEYIAWVKKIKPGRDAPEEKILEYSKWKELSLAYKEYEALKIEEGVFDFGDLIVKTLKLFRDRPNILAKYREKFKYILIDEFQDTNYAQNELALMLAGKNGNITVVGDDDQSIYRFRGAAVSNMIQFRKNFPDARLVVLSKNYRSTQNILDSSYELIQHNNPDRLEITENVNKKLNAQRSVAGTPPEFIHLTRIENEAAEVARIIKSMHETESLHWSDFAVLVRANSHADPFVRAFQREGVVYQFLGPGKLFRQEEVLELIAYLKVLYNFEDSASFFKVLTLPHFEINPKDLVRITNYAQKYHISLFEASEKVSEIFVSEDTKEKITNLVSTINKELKKRNKETAGQLLYNFLLDTGMLNTIINPDTADAQKKAANISRFFDKLKTYEAEHEDASVTAVVDWIELAAELGESPLAADTDWSETDAVNILTVHSAKGLEFPVVFLVNLVSQRFPTSERSEQIPIPDALIKEILPQGDYHMQEERRLFYVGMTRAKDRLFMTASDYYGEAKREKKLSPFIFEALGGEADWGATDGSGHKQLSLLVNSDLPRTPGKLVKPKVDYLSYSQIETFQTCPMHYKLKYIYKIPTPPSAAQSFGVSIHEVMREFYELVRGGERADEKLILSLLSKHWRREGYSDKTHERMYFERGKRYLSGFLKKSFDKQIVPEKLEEKFIVSLKPEHGRTLKIGGVMDRVDIVGEDSIEIIDYKTGEKVPSQNEVDKNLQLSFYALAASNIPGPLFGKKPENIKLSLYYFETQQKISTKRTLSQLKKAEEELFEVRRQIEESDFSCSHGYICQNKCEYSSFCLV